MRLANRTEQLHHMKPALLFLVVATCFQAQAADIPGKFVPDPGRPGYKGGGPVYIPPEQHYHEMVSPLPTGSSSANGTKWEGTPDGYVEMNSPISSWRGSGGPALGPGSPPGVVVYNTPIYVPVPRDGKPRIPTKPTTPGGREVPVPAPLGIGAFYAFFISRKLRKRVKQK